MSVQKSIRAGRTLALLALALAGSLWGTGFVFGKIALEELSVSHMILYRFAFAALVFLFVLARRPIRIARADWPVLLLSALFGVPISFLVQFEGLAYTTVSHASLMVGATPVLLAAGSYVAFRERLGAIGWSALVASTVGVALIATNGAASASGPVPSVRGDLLVLGSLVASVLWILLCKRLMERYPPTEVGALIIFVGTIMLAIWVFMVDGAPPVSLRPATWAALAIQGILATACTTLLWNWGLSRIPAGEAGVFLNLEPVVGAICGVWLFHEVLGPMALIGGALIVVAAVAVSHAAQRESQASPVSTAT